MTHTSRVEYYDHLFKVLLIGDSGVGKSCLLTRFAERKFIPEYISTIGVDFTIRTLEIGGKFIKLQVWDTSGEERFRTITSSYYRGAHVVMIVYDVSERRSFEHVQFWLDELERYAEPATAKILVGNKTDILRTVSEEEGRQLSEKLQLPYIETSAKNSTNVEQLFNSLVRHLVPEFPISNKTDGLGLSSTPRIDLVDPTVNPRRCCQLT